MTRSDYRFADSREPHFLTSTLVAWLPPRLVPDGVRDRVSLHRLRVGLVCCDLTCHGAEIFLRNLGRRALAEVIVA